MKNLVICEADIVKLKRLKKGTRQMVTCAGRLYRTDDEISIKDSESNDAMIIYDLDSTQPWYPYPKLVNPDMTRIYIDSAKIAGTKKHIWGTLNHNKTMDILTVVVVLGALLWGFLSAGGM